MTIQDFTRYGRVKVGGKQYVLVDQEFDECVLAVAIDAVRKKDGYYPCDWLEKVHYKNGKIAYEVQNPIDNWTYFNPDDESYAVEQA